MPIQLGQAFSFDQTLPAAPSGAQAFDERQVGVLVVGAGLAGLSCAFRLAEARRARQQPPDVLVLEREGTVGGRVRSLAAGGSVVNLGAVTFQPTHYPRYMALLSDLGLLDKVRPLRRGRMLLGIGQRATAADNLSLAWDGLKGLAGQGVFTPPEALQLLRFYFFLQRVTGPRGQEEFMALHAISVSEWARRFGFSPGLREKFVETFAGFCFQSPDDFSAAFGIFLLGFNLSSPANLAGGFCQVPEAMAARLDGHVETGSLVLDVQREAGGFNVLYQQVVDGSQQLRRVRARRLVMAAPASVAGRLLPEMRPRADAVQYGLGTGTVLMGRTRQSFDLHMRRLTGPAGMAILGGEAHANGGTPLLNVLAYRGRFDPAQAGAFMADGDFTILAQYNLCPAVAAPAPGQTPLPTEWGDGLYMAGDCTGLFPSQETAVSSGEEVARRLQDD